MFAPAIVCLNMVVFRALSSAASSAGGVAKIWKKFSVFAKSDFDHIRSTWALTCLVITVLL